MTNIVDEHNTTRDLDDAVAVIAVITALAANTAAPQAESPRSEWGSPAHRLAAQQPGPHTWWSSGAAR